MGTINHIYTLNYIINQQTDREERGKANNSVPRSKIKAAFDSVNREVLIGTMRGRGIREGLVRRIEEVIRAE